MISSVEYVFPFGKPTRLVPRRVPACKHGLAVAFAPNLY
jgi:hypothetical protein